MPKFTDKFLSTLAVEPGKKDKMLFDTACPGLGVRVTAKGSKTFLAQWTDPATKRKVREALGQWGSITIEQARDATRARLGDVAKGINPKATRLKIKAEDARERAEAALTFDALVSDWAKLHLASKRPGYASEAQRAIRLGLAGLMNKPAARISRTEAVNALDVLVKAGKNAMAARTLAYARAAYQWAVKREKVPANPFAGLPIAVTSASRDRTLTDSEVAEVWAATGGMAYPWGPFFRLALLTLQRREEVAGMCWSELSEDQTVWRIPGSRMKNGKPHDVHLTEAAREVLKLIPRIKDQDLVFSTTGKTAVSGFSKGKTAMDNAIIAARAKAASEAGAEPAPLVPFVTHDFRRTGVSTLARMGFDSIVVDKLLAHQPAKLTGVAAVYQRHDFAAERALALDAWAKRVTGGSVGGNVLPMTRAVG